MMDIKTKKSVSFGENSIQPVTDQHYFTEEEMPALWYDKDELRVIRKQVRNIVQHLEEVDLKTDCWRGLAKYANRTNRYTRFHKYVGPVLDLYDRRRSEGEEDHFSIGSFSRRLSQRETREAIKLAAKDFLDAYEIHRENWREQKWSAKTVNGWFAASSIKASHRPVAKVATASEMARTA